MYFVLIHNHKARKQPVVRFEFDNIIDRDEFAMNYPKKNYIEICVGYNNICMELNDYFSIMYR